MPGNAQSRLGRHVLKATVAHILKENVTRAHGSDEQVWLPVIIDIRERGRNTDPVLEPNAGQSCNILEFALAQIPPKPVPAKLADEIEIEAVVSIDIGDRDSRPVIIM